MPLIHALCSVDSSQLENLLQYEPRFRVRILGENDGRLFASLIEYTFLQSRGHTKMVSIFVSCSRTASDEEESGDERFHF